MGEIIVFFQIPVTKPLKIDLLNNSNKCLIKASPHLLAIILRKLSAPTETLPFMFIDAEKISSSVSLLDFRNSFTSLKSSNMRSALCIEKVDLKLVAKKLQFLVNEAEI